MSNKKWKDYSEAALSGQWQGWPQPPFDITTLHGVTFNVRYIDPKGHLEGVLPDGRTQIATFEYVDINSIVLPTPSQKDQPEGKMTLRWVKASERLPHDQNEEYFLRHRTEEWNKLTGFYDNDAKQFYVAKTPSCGMAYLEEIPSLEWLEEVEETSSPAVLSEGAFPDWISWRTENGWNMQPDASWLKHGNSSSRRNTESLYALYESEKAKAKPTEPAPAQQGEIPEEIESLLKNLARSGWQFARNAHRLYPDNKHTFSDYSATTLPKDLEPAIACYHKMQEEIAIYKNMWMIADKTMNELRLKVQELNKITNG